MKHQRASFLIIILFALFLVSACNKSAPKAEDKSSSALLTASDAKNISYSKNNGTDQLTYDVKADYPATGLIEDIKLKLKKQGWKPLKEDFLNPGIRSSMERGWSKFEDATKSPEKTVHQWITDWSNNNSDVVRYVLRYEYPKGKEKDLKNLNVNVVYIPAAIAKDASKQIKELQDKYSQEQKKHLEGDIKSRSTGGIKENIKVYLAELSPGNGLKEIMNPSSDQKLYIPKDPVITSNDIAILKISNVDDGTEFRLELNAEGTKKLHAVTKENIGKRMVIYYNDEFCNAPTIREAIDSGSFMAFKPKPELNKAH